MGRDDAKSRKKRKKKSDPGNQHPCFVVIFVTSQPASAAGMALKRRV